MSAAGRRWLDDSGGLSAGVRVYARPDLSRYSRGAAAGGVGPAVGFSDRM
jgi:hypothetical protein